jgi:hypothetical protein
MQGAKKAVRDSILSQRFVTRDKCMLMRDARAASPERLEATAMKLGIIGEPPPRPDELPGSPYRLRTTSPTRRSPPLLTAKGADDDPMAA